MKTTRRILAILLSMMFVFSCFAAGSSALAADVQEDVYAAQEETDDVQDEEWTVGDWISALINMVNLGAIWQTLSDTFSTIGPMLQAFFANIINFFTGAKA